MPLTDPSLVDPCLFWFWNATPAPSEIDAKLDAFLSKGFRGVYVHPMPQSFRPNDFHGGMEVEYLSDAFFELIRYTCQAMSARGMSMWLYDEGGWPSGMAGGRVVQENPAFGVWMLKKDGETIQPVKLIHEISYPDLMNPEATDCFIRHTHEQYRAAIGSEFGRTVRGIFTDEARLIGRVGTGQIPWSPLLPARFAEDHGYDLESILPELFVPADASSARQRVQRQYLATVSGLIAENYYERIHGWCENHGLLFEGHHSGEDDFARHGQYFGNYLQQARHYHIPGVDTIWRQIFPGMSGGNYVQLASSAAWSAGERIAISESFAVYGAGLTLEQMKWIAAFQLVRGVNKIGAMASLHSVERARRVSVGTDLSEKTPIWQDIDLWCAFVRNAARFTLRGRPAVKAGVLYRSELVSSADEAAFNQAHELICDCLHDAMVSWMFVDAEDLCRKGLRIVFVHAASELDMDETNALVAFAENGGEVVWLGLQPPPERIRLLVKRVDHVRQIDLSRYASIQVDRPVAGVRLRHLLEEKWQGFLFFNQNATPIELAWRPTKGLPLRRVNLDDTDVAADSDRVSEKGLRITLNPGEMRAYESCEKAVNEEWSEAWRTEVQAEWSVRRKTCYTIGGTIEVRSVDEPTTMKQLADFSERDRAFSGSLVYETNFNLEQSVEVARILIDLGKVYYSAEVWCNGRSAGRRAWGPYLFDITEQVRTGRNTLRVRVTNTLANQWARPDVRLRDRTQWGSMYLEKIIPFIDESIHCGLVGPVVLRGFTREAQQ